MNLFVAGWRSAGAADADRARAAIEALLESLPFFAGRPIESWTAPSGSFAAAWVRHDDALPYACERDGSLALFSGRPFRWTADDEADGRAPTDAGFFLAPTRSWLDTIDGRFAALVYRGGENALEIVPDAVGAYPVHRAPAAGAHWFSNSAALLRELAGSSTLRLDSVAGLVGGGWPLEGHPMWDGIARIAPGTALRIDGSGESETELLGPADLREHLGSGLDTAAAARRLTAAVRALADWPGRPSVVPVTGGRDSRAVLAAALAAEIDFGAATGGAPDDPDVTSAARLCETAGVAHSLLPADPHGNLWSDHRRAARVVRLTAGGTASLADSAGFPLGPRGGPLALWHSGQGGEVGRSYYGTGEGLDADALTRRLYDAFTARRPHRRELLSADGRSIVEAQIRDWVSAQLGHGMAAADVLDVFYLSRRMATWAAPTHGCVEYVRDTTSPLWSRRLVGDLLAPPTAERAREPYHRAVVTALAPALAEIPFSDGGGWARPAGPARRARRYAAKAARELSRRMRARLPTPDAATAGADPFTPILADVREQVLSASSHAAWDVLDRDRCEAVLSRPAGGLDEMSRYHVWRLATLFVE